MNTQDREFFYSLDISSIEHQNKFAIEENEEEIEYDVE